MNSYSIVAINLGHSIYYIKKGDTVCCEIYSRAKLLLVTYIIKIKKVCNTLFPILNSNKLFE
jgi:hypothetical protein